MPVTELHPPLFYCPECGVVKARVTELPKVEERDISWTEWRDGSPASHRASVKAYHTPTGTLVEHDSPNGIAGARREAVGKIRRAIEENARPSCHLHGRMEPAEARSWEPRY